MVKTPCTWCLRDFSPPLGPIKRITRKPRTGREIPREGVFVSFGSLSRVTTPLTLSEVYELQGAGERSQEPVEGSPGERRYRRTGGGWVRRVR